MTLSWDIRGLAGGEDEQVFYDDRNYKINWDMSSSDDQTEINLDEHVGRDLSDIFVLDEEYAELPPFISEISNSVKAGSQGLASIANLSGKLYKGVDYYYVFGTYKFNPSYITVRAFYRWTKSVRLIGLSGNKQVVVNREARISDSTSDLEELLLDQSYVDTLLSDAPMSFSKYGSFSLSEITASLTISISSDLDSEDDGSNDGPDDV